MTAMKQVFEVLDLMDGARVDGSDIKNYLEEYGVSECEIVTLKGEKGKTDVLKVLLPGTDGKSTGGKSPTLGIIGQLGGIGARPKVLGMVSDADGAIVAVAAAAKLAQSNQRGDNIRGDVLLTTHISPDAPILPHDPVPFMISPVPIMDVLRECVDSRMDAVISVDATKGNRVIKKAGFAITATVKNGWVLRVSDDFVDIYERVTGEVVSVVPITMQDITPYGNNVYHINSIMQPWVMTESPVLGLATTAAVPVPGSGSGANYPIALEAATRFCIEVARNYTSGSCRFYDEKEYSILLERYGDLASLLRKM